jgi:hypothetical protein
MSLSGSKGKPMHLHTCPAIIVVTARLATVAFGCAGRTELVPAPGAAAPAAGTATATMSTLTFEPTDAVTNDSFGTIRIPFVATSE